MKPPSIFDEAEFSAMESVDQTIDGTTTGDMFWTDEVHRAPDGGLAWASAVPADQRRKYADHVTTWLTTTTVTLQGRSVNVRFHTAEAKIDGPTLQTLARFLEALPDTESDCRRAIQDDFANENSFRDLVSDLHDGLDPAYWAQLFPAVEDADAVTAENFSAALTLSDVSFLLNRPSTHDVVIDFRLLVAELAPDDKRSDDYLPFGERFDVTNQIVAVKMMRDGRIVAIDHES